jgi:hypothetical protein
MGLLPNATLLVSRFIAEMSKKSSKATFPVIVSNNYFRISGKMSFTMEDKALISYPTSTRRHGNFAGVHTLLRIILSSNSAVLNNIITGVSPPHFDFFVFYVLCQC